MNAMKFEDFQNFSKQQVEAATAYASTLTKSMQEIATETADYSKHAMTTGAETMEKLLSAKSVETAFQIQTEYAKSAYEGFVAKATKINEIFAKLAAEAVKPAQTAFAKVAEGQH
jgi:hypothetical protein